MLTTGRRLRRSQLDIFWAGNEAGHPRLGLVVSKGRASGVARNRLRRRLKEIWRRELAQRVPAWDVVIRTRRETYAASFVLLQADLVAWRDAVAAG